MSSKLCVLTLVGGLLVTWPAYASVDWSIVGSADGEPSVVGTATTRDLPVDCTSSPSFCELSGTLTLASGTLGGPGTSFDLASDPDTVTISITASPPAAGDNFNLFNMTRDGYFCNGTAPFTLACEYNFGTPVEFVLELAPPSVAIGNGNILITGQFLANGMSITPQPKTYQVGDRGPANGWVFYVTADGLHGLEAAPEDQSTDSEWGCKGVAIQGADGLLVGTGAQNTGGILTWCMEAGTAARVVDNYWLNGYGDWFLPSRDELQLMYDNLGNGNTAEPNVGGFADDLYWSSSENSNQSKVRVIHFLTGAAQEHEKDTSFGVRAARAF